MNSRNNTIRRIVFKRKLFFILLFVFSLFVLSETAPLKLARSRTNDEQYSSSPFASGSISSPSIADKNNTSWNIQLALKVSRVNFTNTDLEDNDVDYGTYLGLEAYMQLISNLYIGGEIGYAKPDGKVEYKVVSMGRTFDAKRETDLTFTPVEMNIKYVFREFIPRLSFDVGTGLSMIYVEREETTTEYIFLDVNKTTVSEDDWIFGGQVFMNANFALEENVFLGIHGKYQVTAKSFYEDFNNWRIGGQLGFRF